METIEERLIALYWHFFVFNSLPFYFILILAFIHNLKALLKREKKRITRCKAFLGHRVMMFLINYWQLKF